MAYQPIQNYGIIGNMRTAALVSIKGSIDWFCVPHFDSPSVFAAILDDEKGGRFEIAPTRKEVSSETAVLAGDEHADYALLLGERGRRNRRFHAGRPASQRSVAPSTDSPGESDAGKHGVSSAMPSRLRLRAGGSSNHDHRTGSEFSFGEAYSGPRRQTFHSRRTIEGLRQYLSSMRSKSRFSCLSAFNPNRAVATVPRWAKSTNYSNRR